jgi:hypothetical protein
MTAVHSIAAVTIYMAENPHSFVSGSSIKKSHSQRVTSLMSRFDGCIRQQRVRQIGHVGCHEIGGLHGA